MFIRIFNKIFQNKNQKWTFYAQASRMLSGLAFVGLLTRSLQSETLGTWYVFVAMFGIATLVEMGFGQIIGRHAAYLKADQDAGLISNAGFLEFTRIGERFYFFISIAAGSVALPAGIWWLGKVHGSWEFPGVVAGPWLVYVIGGMLAMQGAFYSALLNGSGRMWLSQRASIFSIVINISTLLTLLVFPGTLWIPALAQLFAQLVNIFILRKSLVAFHIIGRVASVSESALSHSRGIMKNIARDAAKMSIGMISYQLLTSGFLLILAKYLSKSEVGSYGLTNQLVSVVISLSIIWSQSNFFEMASARQSGDILALRRIFTSGLIRSVGVSLIGMCFLFWLAPHLLRLIGSKTNILEPLVLLVALGALWLEFTLSQFAQMLIAVGEMRIAYVSVVVAILICGFAGLLLSFGQALGVVLTARAGLFAIFYGTPVLIMSWRQLRLLPSDKKGLV